MIKFIFPSILILLDFGAAVVFACCGDCKKSGVLDCGSCFKYLRYILGGRYEKAKEGK